MLVECLELLSNAHLSFAVSCLLQLPNCNEETILNVCLLVTIHPI